jgi:hypothetical protein
MKIFIIYLTLITTIFSSSIKVATYNVENLFDDVYNGSEYKDYQVSRNGWSSRLFKIKLEHISEAICDLNADIIALEEIENANALAQLQKSLKRVGCSYRYSAITQKKKSSIQVAILSRYLIRSSRDIVVSRSLGFRNILDSVIDIDGYPVHIFVNHWKSRKYNGYESKRIRYAKALKKRLEQLKGREYIILGDFNTNYNDFKLDKRIDDTNGRVALFDILPLKYNNKPVDKKTLLSHKSYLYDLWYELPYAQRYSGKFYRHTSTLDHIILPYSMFDGKGVDYVDNSFGVFKPKYLLSKGATNRWQIKNHKHLAKGYSDHLPIYALFDIKPYKNSNTATKVESKSIDYLYSVNSLSRAITLKDVVVLLKRGNYAILKQKGAKKGIFVYGAKGLEEGRIYDVEVDSISTYHGLKEINSLHIIKSKSKVSLEEFYSDDFSDINGVVRDVSGVYKNGYLYMDNKKIAIYFKNRKIKPKNGSKIKIYYAHIGYYKRVQLVVYSKKDFILE